MTFCERHFLTCFAILFLILLQKICNQLFGLTAKNVLVVTREIHITNYGKTRDITELQLMH